MAFINKALCNFIDWLDTPRVLGTILILVWCFIILELFTGFPSWYLKHVLQGLRVFLTDYILLGSV